MSHFFQSNNGVYRFEPSIRGLSLGAIGKSANRIDYTLGQPQVRAAEKELIENLTGVPKKNILTMSQVHGDTILIIDDLPALEPQNDPEADGMITSLPGTCLVIRSADCVPVFMYDQKQRILGAVHSGWKGTALSIAAKTARLMNELCRSEYQNLLVRILPSIGPESYEVKEDVASLFPRDIDETNGRTYLNLRQNIERSLTDLGVPAGNIVNSSLCTLTHRAEFYSYRGGDKRRNLNFGYMEVI